MVNVTTYDGGTSVSPIRFTINPPVPTILTSIFDNSTRTSLVTFTLTGANYQSGPGNTTVTLYNATYLQTPGNANLTAQITTVTPTAITGNFTVPADSPIGKNTWQVNVTTVNGGMSVSTSWFTVTQQVRPTISGMNVTSGYLNTTVPFTLTGTNYQVGGTFGSVVTFYNSSFFDTYGHNLTVTLTSVKPLEIKGLVTIPGNTTTSRDWMVNVTTYDGGTSVSPIRFTINPPVPMITTSTFDNSTRTSLVTFMLTGANYQPGPGNTTVTLYNATYLQTPGNANLTAQTDQRDPDSNHRELHGTRGFPDR